MARDPNYPWVKRQNQMIRLLRLQNCHRYSNRNSMLTGIDCPRPEVQAKRYAGVSGDIPTIPSPFYRPAQSSKKRSELTKTDIDRTDGISLVSTEALSSMDDICSREVTASQATSPTLLPFRTTKSIPQGVMHSFPSTVLANTNDAYLGELLVRTNLKVEIVSIDLTISDVGALLD